jgi:hypothetical protein
VLVNLCLEGLVLQDEPPKFATLSANIEFDINVKYEAQEFGPILQKIKNALGQEFTIKITNAPFNHGNGLKSLLLSFTVKEGTMPKDAAIAKAQNAVTQSVA